MTVLSKMAARSIIAAKPTLKGNLYVVTAKIFPENYQLHNIFKTIYTVHEIYTVGRTN